VIGLPGETIEVRGKTVYVDGTPIEEPYVQFLFPFHEDGTTGGGLDVRSRYGPVTVPADHFFMMGDNRTGDSGASRHPPTSRWSAAPGARRPRCATPTSCST
jgi:signal peptidase I